MHDRVHPPLAGQVDAVVVRVVVVPVHPGQEPVELVLGCLDDLLPGAEDLLELVGELEGGDHWAQLGDDVLHEPVALPNDPGVLGVGPHAEPAVGQPLLREPLRELLDHALSLRLEGGVCITADLFDDIPLLVEGVREQLDEGVPASDASDPGGDRAVLVEGEGVVPDGDLGVGGVHVPRIP